MMKSDGIHCIPVSTPFAVGKCNVYFVPEPVPTLIDAPLNGEPYLRELEDGLQRLGSSIRALRRIIVTHPHLDHFGAARAIVESSGAEVWVASEGARWLEHYEEELREDEIFSREFLAKAGVDGGWVEKALPHFFEPARTLAASVKPSRYLADGDEFHLSSTRFTAKAVPGHTPWCLLFFAPETGLAFTGDFLLKEISPNALCQDPRLAPRGYRSLKAYIGSLQQARQMHLTLALPGHGDVIERPSARIDELLSFIGERRRQVLSILASGAKTPFQIVQAVFPDLPENQLFLGVSEITGHLELLEDEGLAERTGRKVLRFSTV